MSEASRPPLHIAIDGMVATGKSTVCEEVARRLGILYLDTGVMYRAVALVALEHNANIDSDEACGAIAERIDLRIVPPTVDDGRQSTVLIGDRDVTWEIRADAVNHIVSRVSSHPRVRAALHMRQRQIAREHSVIMAGRDIASVVLPNAQVKIMLTASLDERVHRRAAELQARHPGTPIDLAALRAEIQRRDDLDSPQLRMMPDTVVVDTDGLTIDQVVARILEVAHEHYG
jgi:CMP/dCMP kinase